MRSTVSMLTHKLSGGGYEGRRGPGVVHTSPEWSVAGDSDAVIAYRPSIVSL